MRKGGGHSREEGGKGAERGTTEQRHPSHAAVAAQLHFATSILPARSHSHSVDPFAEGMSHMPSSSLPPSPLFPPVVFPASLRTPAPRFSTARRHPLRTPVSVSHGRFSFYLIPSIPLLHPSSPTSTPAPSRPPALPPPRVPTLLSLSLFLLRPLSLFPFLSRSLVHCTKVSLFLSDSLLCDAGR